MRRLFVYTLISLLAGCNQNDPSPDIPTFADREDVAMLESESGRIKYYCGADTSFFYLEADDPTIPFLVFDDVTVLKRFFTVQWQGDVEFLLSDPCSIIISDNLQEPELQVKISGNIKAAKPEDNFLVQSAAPFVLEKLEKVKACPVTYEESDQVYPFHNTRWRLVEVKMLSETFYPSCEYNNILITFTLENYGNDRNIFEYKIGDMGCEYTYVITTGTEINIKQEACTGGFSGKTTDMKNLIDRFFEVLNDPGKSSGTFEYQMTGNILLLNDGQGGIIKLIGT